MKTPKALLLPLALALLAGAAPGQTRVGLVDLRKVFDEYHKTKTADAALKDRAAELDKEKTRLVEDYKKLRQEHEDALNSANDLAVSPQERERRKKRAEDKLVELQLKQREIEQFDREARANLAEQERRMREKIIEEIRGVINAKARAAGYAVVLDTAAESINRTPIVLFTSGEHDLTAAVLDQLNATAPASFKKEEKQ